MEFTSFSVTSERLWCISLKRFKIQIIHVGNMANKGTEALLKSDICVLQSLTNGQAAFSVSTTDIEGVKRLKLPLNAVLPTMIDIPYEKADTSAKKLGFSRANVKYKVFAIGSLVFMLFQALMSAGSAISVKLGLKGFYRADVLKNIKDSDVVVSYSDENFKETASFLPLNVYWVLTWWSMLFSRVWDVLTAKYLGKHVVMFPNSIGPFRTGIGRLMARLALNSCDHVLVREPISYEVVNSLGVGCKTVLTSDTTILLPGKASFSLDGVSRPLIGVSPGFYAHSLSEEGVEKYISEHAKLLDIAVEKYGFSVVFLPHYVRGFGYDDLEVSKLIMGRMSNKERARILELDSAEAFKSALGCMDMVVSSKMHPAVLATSCYVPTLCIAYDEKQSGFFRLLQLGDCVVSIRDFTCARLSLKLDFVWRRKKEIRASLKKKIPVLQQNVREAIRYVLIPFLEVR
ncbi:MAG: polysaccharide pyruvyl transferase family protein [Promethearchaeota archaeon]